MDLDIIKLRNESSDLFDQDKYIEIIDLLTDKVLEQFKDAELYSWRSLAYFALKDDKDIMMFFAEKAIDADSDFFLGYIAMGCALYIKGNINNAIANYNKAIDLKPDNASAYKNRADAWKETKDIEKSLADYNKAIALNPDYAYAYNSRANLWNKKGDYEKAIIDYNKAIDLKPYNAYLYYNRGFTRYENGDYEKALEDYSKSIDLKSDYAVTYNSRGNIWFKKGNFEKAIEDYDKAIELKPDHFEAYNNRGIALANQKKFDIAIENFNKSIDLLANNAIAYNNRGSAWKEKGDFNKAIDDYNNAIDLSPDFYDAYNNRGIVWHDIKNFEKAIVDYNKVIELNPDYAAAYNNIGIVLHDIKNYEKAKENFNKAIELKPDYFDAYVNRGNLWNEKGDLDKAMADYNKAIELNPDYGNAYYNRGLLKKTVENKLDESIKDFEKYLELTSNNNNIGAKRARGFVEELRERIKDSDLKSIGDLTSKIKKLLLITEGCVTHYTGLTVVKKLIIEDNNNFRISEGAFLNDTSEGTELFNFLQYQFFFRNSDGLVAETFAPKPFIGSFVSESKYDDLNMWRFYGKENGIEATGCAITLRINEFIEAINSSLTKTDEKSNRRSSEDDINFYRVAYWDHNLCTINFHIPNSKRKVEKELNKLMIELKKVVTNYKNEDKSILEKYLNSIAFLFKSDAYKNENELRLVIKGIEFDKRYDMDANPPRVYIELVNIRSLVEQITLGPKVDKSDEWAAAIYYSYDKETKVNRKPKNILISHLPYK